MSDFDNDSAPNFGLSFKYRAYQELLDLAPTLIERARAQGPAPEPEVDLLDQGCINYKTGEDVSPKPLTLPSIGSDAAKLVYVNLPSESDRDPTVQVGLSLYKGKNAFVAEGDDKDEGNDYDVCFGGEMDPFIVQFAQVDRIKGVPIGEILARAKNKRDLSDEECEAVVAMVATSMDGITFIE